MTPSPVEADAELLAPTAELALFVGGALLTLLVIAFVTMLVISIVREERAMKTAQTPEARLGGDDPDLSRRGDDGEGR